MVTRTKSARAAAEAEFLPADEIERKAQAMAAQTLMSMPEQEYIEPEPEPDDVALQTVLSELGADGTNAKVNVYQLDTMKNKAFVGAFLPSEFSLENVQKQYGPGDYEIRVYDNRGLKTRRIIKIAEPKKQEQLPVMHAQNETAKLIEVMQSGFNQMGQTFAQALGQLAQSQPKPKTTLETLQEMRMMREIMGFNSQPQNSVDPLKILEIATGLAEKITPRVGEPGTGEVILEAIKNFGPMLSNGFGQAAQQNALPSPVMRNPAAPVIPLQQNPIQSPTNEGDEQMNIMKKYYLNLLIAQAQANNDPVTYANMMLDVIGEEKSLAMVNTPDWFELLCKEEPRAVNYRLWFESMRAIIIELTGPEDDAITGENSTSESAPDVPRTSQAESNG